MLPAPVPPHRNVFVALKALNKLRQELGITPAELPVDTPVSQAQAMGAPKASSQPPRPASGASGAASAQPSEDPLLAFVRAGGTGSAALAATLSGPPAERAAVGDGTAPAAAAAARPPPAGSTSERRRRAESSESGDSSASDDFGISLYRPGQFGFSSDQDDGAFQFGSATGSGPFGAADGPVARSGPMGMAAAQGGHAGPRSANAAHAMLLQEPAIIQVAEALGVSRRALADALQTVQQGSSQAGAGGLGSLAGGVSGGLSGGLTGSISGGLSDGATAGPSLALAAGGAPGAGGRSPGATAAQVAKLLQASGMTESAAAAAAAALSAPTLSHADAVAGALVASGMNAGAAKRAAAAMQAELEHSTLPPAVAAAAVISMAEAGVPVNTATTAIVGQALAAGASTHSAVVIAQSFAEQAPAEWSAEARKAAVQTAAALCHAGAVPAVAVAATLEACREQDAGAAAAAVLAALNIPADSPDSIAVTDVLRMSTLDSATAATLAAHLAASDELNEAAAQFSLQLVHEGLAPADAVPTMIALAGAGVTASAAASAIRELRLAGTPLTQQNVVAAALCRAGVSASAAETALHRVGLTRTHAKLAASAAQQALSPVAAAEALATTQVEAEAADDKAARHAAAVRLASNRAVASSMSRLAGTEFGAVQAGIDMLRVQQEAAGSGAPTVQMQNLLAMQQEMTLGVRGAQVPGASLGFDLGVGADGSSTQAAVPADAAEATLSMAVQGLSGALGGLLTAASRAKTRKAAAGVDDDDDDEADAEGKELIGSEAAAMQLSTAIQSAVLALASASGESSSTDRATAVANLRGMLFELVADAGEAVNDVIKDAGIRAGDLRVMAAAELTALQSSKSGSRRGAGAGQDASAGSGDEDEDIYAAFQSTRATSARDQSALLLDADGRVLRAGERAQMGLVESVPNPTQRRMKAVALTAHEILAALQRKLSMLGMFKALGDKRRQVRVATKLWAVGHCMLMVRLRARMRRSVQLFAVGFLQGAVRRRAEGIRRARIAALAITSFSMQRHREARRCAKLWALGHCMHAMRLRQQRLRAAKIFALGTCPMWVRTEGKPTGYVFPKKTKASAKSKGPKMRTVAMDVIKDVSGTMFEGAPELTDRRLFQLFPDLRDMFENKPRLAAAGKAAAFAAKLANKPKEIKWLQDESGKRYQNMSIAISRFKNAGFDKLSGSIHDMDLESIPDGVDCLQILLDPQQMPTAEDLSNAKNHATPDGLGLPETFVWHMSKVPLYKQRIEAMIAQAQWDNECGTLQTDVDAMLAACEEILTADKLRRFLVRYVLPFHAALNAGSKKATARGVKLSAIARMSTTKTVKDPKRSMLDYLVEKVADTEPAILTMREGFSKCWDAKGILDENLTKALGVMRKTVKLVETAVGTARTKNDTVFVSRIEPFAAMAAKALTDSEQAVEQLNAKVREAAVFVGEGDKTKPETLIEEVTKAVQAFNEAVLARRAKLEAAMKAAKKLRREAQKKRGDAGAAEAAEAERKQQLAEQALAAMGFK